MYLYTYTLIWSIMYHILFINDNPLILKDLMRYNQANNLHYIFHEIKSSIDILKFIYDNPPSLILISCSLVEDVSELNIIKSIKLNSLGKEIPLILCTQKDSEEEHIAFLNHGADDVFWTKLSLPLLFSKTNALLRKKNATLNNINSFERVFVFMNESFEVDFKGKRHKLTSKEFIILKTLVENPNKTFSQDELNELSSGVDVYVSKRCVDTFISLIRRKIGRNCILSIRNKGYQINQKILNFDFNLN